MTVSQLALDHGVSAITVHRDLAELASEGLIERVHGGARTVDGDAEDNAPVGAELPGPGGAGALEVPDLEVAARAVVGDEPAGDRSGRVVRAWFHGRHGGRRVP